MKKLLSLIIILLLCHSALESQNITKSRIAPKREFRGAWFPTVVNSTWRNMSVDEIKADIIRNLDIFKKLNINAVIFQVRPQGDAMYISEIEPWSRFLTGRQGKAPDPLFDPAQFIIEECHKRGMEMHAWFNPYRVSSNKDEVLSENHLYFKKPELFVKYGNQIYFDPGRPESREHTVRVISDFVIRYDVDAVHFDDYFYPYKVAYEDFPDEETFRIYHERDGFSKFSKDEWRRNNVNTLVKELSMAIKSLKPWVRFGISPFGVWRNETIDPKGSKTTAFQTNYDDLYADILLWTKEGWIDYNAPQLYWEIGHKRADYLTLIKWWAENSNGVNLYIGQNIKNQINFRNTNGDIVNQLYRKMDLVRNNPAIGGNIWWSGLSFPDQKELMDSLMQNYQKFPALTPLYLKVDTIPPDPVTTLVYKKGFLTWDSKETSDPMQKPHFYCVYKFYPGQAVNIDDPSAIVTVTGEKRFYAGKERRVRYVVTVLDRLQNESIPSDVVQR